MYIGAWTEYRLAQEQVQTRRQNAAQPGGSSSGSTRKGAGIYHPSLSDKGGMGVAGLPDRESFRRTLESALSSNLAADDVENISQALEPLMQRLPTVHAPPAAIGAPALAPSSPAPTVSAIPHTRRQRRKALRSMGRLVHPISRQQKRKCGGYQNWEALNGRCGGGHARYVHTRSDAGTCSAAEATSDGARSTRSGFSVASAPSNTGAGLEGGRVRPVRLDCGRNIGGVGFGEQQRWGSSCGSSRAPQLPLIIDTRRRRRSSSGHAYSGNTSSVVRNRLYPSASASADPAEACPEGDAAGISCRVDNRTPTSAPSGKTTYDGKYEAPLARERGGYDGGAAATILRMARRRDPAGLNVNFEQFWKWKRRPAATGIGTKENIGTQPTQNETPRQFIKNKNSSARKPAVGEGNAATASKLETLARMKTVYMTKEDSNNDGECTPPPPTTAAPPRKYTPPYRPPPEPRPPDPAAGIPPVDGGTVIARSPTAFGSRTFSKLSKSTTGDETGCMNMHSTRGIAQGWTRSYEDVKTKSGADIISQSNSHRSNTTAVVEIPDLDLTESRIRQVDKYFGGDGGAVRHRRPAAEVG